MSQISPLAYIDPEAKIGKDCEIGAFCFIDKNVEIGDNNVLMNNVTVLSGARIGRGQQQDTRKRDNQPRHGGKRKDHNRV